MNNSNEDRRVRRTKKLLKQGLSELMKEKDFKDISVKDITDRMDLNRGTFYLHYNDIYDLLEKIEDDVIHDFQTVIDKYKSQTQITTLMPILIPLAEYIVENYDICKILFENKASVNFTAKFKKLIVTNGYTLITERFGYAEPEITQYYFNFITYGIIGMLHKWFNDQEALNPKQLVTLADKIITGCASNIFTKK